MLHGIIWIWLLVNVKQIYTLECYSCTSTDRNVSCNTTVACKAQQSCFKDVSAHVTVHGCIDNTQCDLNNGASTLVGRSTNAIASCHECCSTNRCNADLCTHPAPTTCENDETVDCSKLNTLFGVCNDKHHAKTVCAKFCGLCNLVDGNWAAWSSWSNCDVTCGTGASLRTRTCTNPAPRDGGFDCVGNKSESRLCQREVCPVSGGWSGWGNWESCSVTCGVGIQKRHRSCSNPYPSGLGLHCFGEAIDVEICRPGPCADGGWTDWSTWTKCSATCGGGLESRKRTCSNPAPSPLGRYCDGDSMEIVSCNTDACASSGGQTIAFQSKDSMNETVKSNQTIVFTNTSLNEGDGYDNKTGIFTAPKDGTYLFTTQICVYGIIRIWLLVNVKQIYTLECYSCTSTDRNASCNTTVACKAQQSCFKDVSAHVTVHGCIDNTQCDLNNGASTLVGRSTNAIASCHECCSTNRCNADLCTHPAPTTCENDETVDCSKLNTLFGVCNDKHHAKTVCAKFCGLCNLVDGNWAAWSSWSNCDVTCGTGASLRTRTCTNPAPRDGGFDCVGNKSESRLCQREVCPVSGGWSGWGNWESCSVTCGVGIQKRLRSCSNPYPSGLGLHCFGEAIDVEICRPGPCADGGWTDWSTWTKCSATCGGGLESRKRTCSNPAPSPLGRYCDGDSLEIVSCNTDACASSGGQTIAFQSKYSMNETVKSNQTIVFTNTSLNEGDGYDNKTGIFTAPKDGTYLFTTQMCVYGQNYLHWAIIANDVELKKGFFGDGSYNKCYTADAVALLKAGDHVSIKCTTGSAKLLQDGDKWNTFTGVLLH